MFAKFFKRLMQAGLMANILMTEMKSKFELFLCETQSKIFFEFAIYQNAIHGTGLCKDTNMELLHVMLVLIWGPWLMVMMAMM